MVHCPPPTSQPTAEMQLVLSYGVMRVQERRAEHCWRE